jgi:excisionase family DNA binding protein
LRTRRRVADDVSGRLLTARQVAELLGFSIDTILRWTREGRLPAHRVSGTKHGRLRYREDELDTLLAKRSTMATPVREAPATLPGAAESRLHSSSPAIPPRPAAASTEEDTSDATR